jgi:hypothetical protein
MDARHGLAAILRDAVLRTAPQDEVDKFFTGSSQAWYGRIAVRAMGYCVMPESGMEYRQNALV